MQKIGSCNPDLPAILIGESQYGIQLIYWLSIHISADLKRVIWLISVHYLLPDVMLNKQAPGFTTVWGEGGRSRVP